MGIELDILQELSGVNVALSETSSLAQIINGEIRSGEFHERFNKIVDEIAKCFAVVTENLQPFFEIATEADFVAHFDKLHADYSACYLKEISKPRIYCDDAYEGYVLLRLQKEIKTGFPLLKRSFERLDKYIDKWITNDAWLAMAIDNAFKRLQILLNEIATLKKKDPEDAFLIYAGAFQDFRPYLDLIKRQYANLQEHADVTITTVSSDTQQYSVQ
jgi:hypothetical protein